MLERSYCVLDLLFKRPVPKHFYFSCEVHFLKTNFSIHKSTFNQLKFGDVHKKASRKALGISIKKGGGNILLMMVLKLSAVMCVYNIQFVQFLHKKYYWKKCRKFDFPECQDETPKLV